MVRTELHAVELGDVSSPALTGGLPAFEQACAAIDATRLGDPAESARLLALWFDGVALLDATSQGKSGVAQPRVVAAMTRLATAWLAPRFAGEPRPAIHARIADLRPVEQNERMGELFDKRNEGTLAADEKAELYRLGQFFEDLQPILNQAIMALPPLKS